MPEMEQLRCLVALAEHGTLSAAAEELHISQPSLSRSMQALEHDLQVTLFKRTKNKLSLNENGKYAVEYARRILAEVETMTEQIRVIDRARHTILIGSCAPAPLWTLLPELSRRYADQTISSEMRDEDTLLAGLKGGRYQIIILPRKLEDPDTVCIPYVTEQLYLSVPPEHHLASHKNGVYFREFDGENMFVLSEIGFWSRVHTEHLPHSRFLVQNERFDFEELISASVLPHFSTNLTARYFPADSARVQLPILDAEATAHFHLICLRKHSKLIRDVVPQN